MKNYKASVEECLKILNEKYNLELNFFNIEKENIINFNFQKDWHKDLFLLAQQDKIIYNNLAKEISNY